MTLTGTILQVRVDLRVMSMKQYSAFPNAPGLEPIRWFCVISRTPVQKGRVDPLQRCSWHILQPQPTRLRETKECFKEEPWESKTVLGEKKFD